MLSDNYGEGNLSQDSVVTEEIPMNILNNSVGSPEIRRESVKEEWANSPRENQDLLFSPVDGTAQDRDTFVPPTSSNLRYSMNNNRTSLDFTRDNMLATNQLDNRYSVDRARISLDLPGITNAEGLLEGRKSFARDR